MSEWQERANKRRDERHTKAPEPTHLRRQKSKRGQWCKGRKGISHEAVWRYVEWYVVPERKHERVIAICTKCGKHVKWWWKRKYDGPKPKEGQPYVKD